MLSARLLGHEEDRATVAAPDRNDIRNLYAEGRIIAAEFRAAMRV